MAHQAQRRFVATVARHLGGYFTGCTVLEIGSLDINGSVREYFHKCRYTGIDVAPGRGVDVVCQGQDYDAPADSFDQVISCEAMEHNPHWPATFLNMVRMCKPGGLVLMTCATTGRPEHGTARTSARDSPLTVELGWDYYQNLRPEDFAGLGDFDAIFSQYRFWINRYSYDLYFCGIKAGKEGASSKVWEKLVREVEACALSATPDRNYRCSTITPNYLRNLGKRAFRKLSRIVKEFLK